MFGLLPAAMAQKFVAAPFAYSGSWEADNEGWTLSGMTRGGSNGVTGPSNNENGFIFATDTGFADFVIPAAVARGNAITVGVWHTANQYQTSLRRMSYRIGAGSFVQLAQATSLVSGYNEFNATFNNPKNNGVTIRLESSNYGGFDDWSISGVPL